MLNTKSNNYRVRKYMIITYYLPVYPCHFVTKIILAAQMHNSSKMQIHTVRSEIQDSKLAVKNYMARQKACKK
jgi:hypothetical protein